MWTRHRDEDLLDSGCRRGRQWVIKWNPERVSQPDRHCWLVWGRVCVCLCAHVFARDRSWNCLQLPRHLTSMNGRLNQASCQALRENNNIKHQALCRYGSNPGAALTRVLLTVCTLIGKNQECCRCWCFRDFWANVSCSILTASGTLTQTEAHKSLYAFGWQQVSDPSPDFSFLKILQLFVSTWTVHNFCLCTKCRQSNKAAGEVQTENRMFDD